MDNLVSKLSRSALLRRIVRGLRVHKVGNWWLGRFPLIKRMPESGVVYRASRLESIPLSGEMLERGVLYDATLLPSNFTHFADLGCNVGYFSCWLAHLAKGRSLHGIMVDANPQAVEEARWHASANGWTDVHALHGILGERNPAGSVDFYLYESNICSMAQLPDVEAMGLQGKWQKIAVPCLDFGRQWSQRFGGARCHILKVDIEGSELAFLQAEQEFLRQVDSILLEWHKWRVTLDQLRKFLQENGFQYVKTLEENEQMGTAFFLRQQ